MVTVIIDRTFMLYPRAKEPSPSAVRAYQTVIAVCYLSLYSEISTACTSAESKNRTVKTTQD